jgi:fido (protein-threonine AMPylation protein)
MNGIMDEPEGATPLDPDELEGLRQKHITTRGELNELEQANIEAGLLWLARRRQTAILTDEFLRELHRRLFGDVWRWAGTYRLT